MVVGSWALGIDVELYSLLGLSPGASATEIKRAYRRLSRRYHPDINPGDKAAAALYKRISEAYETLLDPQRRQAYETGGQASGGEVTFEFTGFDFSSPAHGPQAATFTELFAEVLHPVPPPAAGRPQQGADIHAAVTIGFEDAMRGVQRHVVVVRQDVCAGCGGAGTVRVNEGRCAACLGTGKVRWARGHMVFVKGCTACEGTGRQQRPEELLARHRPVVVEATVAAGDVVEHHRSFSQPLPPHPGGDVTLHVTGHRVRPATPFEGVKVGHGGTVPAAGDHLAVELAHRRVRPVGPGRQAPTDRLDVRRWTGRR